MSTEPQPAPEAIKQPAPSCLLRLTTINVTSLRPHLVQVIDMAPGGQDRNNVVAVQEHMCAQGCPGTCQGGRRF
eukprot:15125602-Alexandrium_andersonii.AAC.1